MNEVFGECYLFAFEYKCLSVFAMMCMTTSISLIILLMYHTRLLIINRTTNEEMKALKLKFGLNNQLVFYLALRAKTVTFIK